ncbi:hypothetical protein K469DRAFT_263448 [Zopfia rhizophila CBS 207.26]|uniref:Uncharacterized protein n=1 Tax=Zopfia rhizophila CBS 207.26 TaxID=1314779 RepID=A0A6A6DT98_9PEZI|nr:hypothetical protein K469DRAFT_261253 [Zopfia rhizophila CBS 207.26]KAF2181439.1 hypothetical protein K469DRAFT_263448 [Zopfia rhizophila CBS 207.26]
MKLILIDFLSTAMLVIRLESQYSAQACLDRVEELFIPSRDSSLTPTPDTEECETTAGGSHAKERLTEVQPTSSGNISISRPSYSEHMAEQELNWLLL